jgi:hypothetical protein
MSDVILPTEEHGKNTDFARGLVDVEPVDRSCNGKKADPRQDIVARCASSNCKRRAYCVGKRGFVTVGIGSLTSKRIDTSRPSFISKQT